MNLKSILSLLLIASPLAYADKCSDFGSEIEEIIEGCKVNAEGNIVSLSINNADVSDENLNQLFTSDLTELTYIVNGYYNGNTNFTSSIKNLTNLETLVLDYDFDLNPCTTDCRLAVVSHFQNDVLKNLKNLKSLTLKGIHVTQDNIDEISTLSNLETLIFDESYLDDELDYEPIGDLENLKRLDVLNLRRQYIKRVYNLENSSSYYSYYYDHRETIEHNTPKGLLNANKYIKELNIDFFKNKDKDVDGLPTSIEKLVIDPDTDVDISYIENLSNLAYLRINHHPQEQMGPWDDHYPEFSLKLSKLNNLKELVIDHRDITDEVMDEILNAPNLQKLTTIRSHPTADGLEKLKHSDRIDTIDIDSYKINIVNFNDVVATFKSSSGETPTNTTETKTETIVIIETTTEVEPTTTLTTVTSTSTEVITPTTNTKISTNGRCGKEDGVCGEGLCCSKWGWCGKSDAHCSVESGCQSEFGTCNSANPANTAEGETPTIKISTDGRCGKEYGTCGDNGCCSKWGWCGVTSVHCNVEEGCQMEFGACNAPAETEYECDDDTGISC